MGFDAIIGIVASLVTTLTGLGVVLERNGKRIDRRFDSVESKFDTVIELVTDMRANLPLQYTLKDDHLRLVTKVEDLQKDIIVWRHTESKNDI
jgi:hypothetical protein